MSSPDQIEIVTAIHNLERSLATKLTEQANAFRDRVEDVERRHGLELREMQAEIMTKIERIQKELLDKVERIRNETVYARTSDLRSFLATVLGLLTSIGVVLFTYWVNHGK